MFTNDENREILADVLKNNLKVVFCGIAAGKESAKQEYYYAGKRNKFWEMLSKIGLIDSIINPNDYKKVLDFNIGLTDLVKDQSGGEVLISVSERHRKELEEKIIKYSPKILAFNGKKVALEYLKVKDVSYGVYDKKIGNTVIYVLPSTSSMANGYWDDRYWQELGGLVKKL